MEIDIKKIENLLEEKKYDEAKELIKSAFATDLDKDEKGALLLSMAEVYMQVSNSINSKYKKALEEAIEGIKNINAFESKVNDHLKLEEVRGNLG
ncbi:MAG: hypothetical protein WAX44_00130 [Minisyncoccia bacterium]